MAAPEQLKKLHDLQLVDMEIMEIEKFANAAPERIKQFQADLETQRAAVQEREAALQELQKAKREKERELSEHEQRINKNKERMMAVKTNEEYHAIQKENDAQKVFCEEFEDAILRLLDDIDSAELALRKAKDRCAEAEKKVGVQVAAIEEELKTCAGKLVEKQDLRGRLVPDIDPAFFDRYVRLRRQVGGVAVVRVVKRTCQGCRMNVPPQLYNLVIRNEDIITCPNCYRILFYQGNDQANNGSSHG